MNTDTDRLNWLIENLADVEAPELGESSTWVIYTPKAELGAGAGCSKDLRTAIDRAMLWKAKEKSQSSHIDELTAKSIAEKATKIANQNDKK